MNTNIQTVLRMAHREVLDLCRDRRLVIVTSSVFLLLCFAVWSGVRRYADTLQQQETTARDERERWLTQGDRHPHSAAHQGFWVFQPSTLLSILDSGIGTYAGAAVHLEPHSQRLFRYSQAEDATWVQRAGELTAAITLQKFIPLLIILVGFSTLAGERETGTLRMVLSSGVSPRLLAFGKAIGLIVPLASVLIPVAILGGFALTMQGGLFAGSLLSRSLLMAASYAAYFALFILMTLIVSALARTSRQALRMLVFIWITLVFLAPPIVLSVAARQHPTPTALEFASSLQKARAYGPLYFERLVAVEERLLKQYNVDSVDALPVNSEGVAMIEEEAVEDALHDVQFRRLYDAYQGQARVFQWGVLVSPLVGLQVLSMGLSGADLAHHMHFAQAAEDYRRFFVQMMNGDLKENDFPEARRPSSASNPTDLIYVRNRELWEQVPPFIYNPPGLAWIVRQSWIAAAGLMGWLVVVVIVGTIALRRFTVGLS